MTWQKYLYLIDAKTLIYRRKDTNHIVGSIYDRLVNEFGRKNVFKDVDSIPLGSDFRHILGEAVDQCDVILTVIGKGWLDATDRAGKGRLEAKNDFVRVEVEAALERRIPVIPVLVDGASVPTADELPESLSDLSFRNGIQVRYDPDFHNDMDRLVSGLKRTRPIRVQAAAKKAADPKFLVRDLAMAVLLSIVFVAGVLVIRNWLVGDYVIPPKPKPNLPSVINEPQPPDPSQYDFKKGGAQPYNPKEFVPSSPSTGRPPPPRNFDGGVPR